MYKNSDENTLTLGGDEIPYQFCRLPQSELKYYPENPRIYSMVYTGEKTPSQGEIESILQGKDHVKQLYQSILANEGVTDPLWVRDGDYVVLEGNSRLAAIRLLAQKNPIKWGKVKCHLLPADIADKKIFSFLCQCHVIGRQDWQPYEQAGIIYRRYKFHSDSADSMAKEMGIKKSEIDHLIHVYSFMDEHDDTQVDHWSYYHEYLRSTIIGKQREMCPELDGIIVDRVKSGEIPKAEDVRDKVKEIARIGGKVFRAYMKNSKSLDECYEKAIEHTEDSALWKALNKFRVKIGDLDTKKSLRNMDEEPRKKCKYELKKIKQSVDKLLKTI